MISKYAIAYTNALSSAFQYRLNLALFAVSHVVSLSGLIYLWLAVYGSGQELPGYTLGQIITYYIVLTVLRLTIADGVGMGFTVSEEIKDGVVTHYLLKPFSYALEHAARLLGHTSVNAIFVLPALIALAVISRGIIHLPPLFTLLQFAFFGIIGLIFYYLIYFLAALSSFWLYKGGNMIYGVIVASNLLNGSIVPLDLFPDWFQTISHYAPFQFLMFLPIQSYLGNITDPKNLILIATVWILLLICLLILVWRLGLRKFEAVGQ